MFLRSLILATALLTALPATADFQQREERGRERVSEEKPPRLELSLDQAVRMAERQHNAKVIKTETVRENGRTTYKLKLMDKDSNIRWVSVPAN